MYAKKVNKLGPTHLGDKNWWQLLFIRWVWTKGGVCSTPSLLITRYLWFLVCSANIQCGLYGNNAHHSVPLPPEMEHRNGKKRWFVWPTQQTGLEFVESQWHTHTQTNTFAVNKAFSLAEYKRPQNQFEQICHKSTVLQSIRLVRKKKIYWFLTGNNQNVTFIGRKRRSELKAKHICLKCERR